MSGGKALLWPADPGARAGFTHSAADRRPAAEPPRPTDFLCDVGITASAMGCIDAAVQALREATSRDPSLHEAWRALAPLLRMAGDVPAAAAAEAAARANAGTPPPRKPPESLSPGKRAKAERLLRDRIIEGRPREPAGILREHLVVSPRDAAALRLLAELETRSGDLETATLLLQRALELAPDYVAVRLDYAHALMAQSRWIQALQQAEWLAAHDPRDLPYRLLLADLLAITGNVARAADLLEAVLRRTPPRDARFWISYARALRRLGRTAESARAYRTCIEISPANGEAYWGIANLKYEKLSDAELDAIRAHLADNRISEADRFHLHYALAFSLEGSGDYETSFAHYSLGGRLRRTLAERTAHAYNPDETSARVQKAKPFFTPELFAARTGQGCPDPDPIFVVGMPRAGSTLVEQILASHSLVEGTTELPDMGFIVTELLSPRHPASAREYPSRIAALSPAELAALGERYLQTSRAFRKTDRPFFVDKMPGNWLNVGLLHLILPNAKIVDARRSAMACCFATFKQIMVGGSNGAYDLGFIGRRYNDYVALMQHFDTVLPGRVHRVIYEDLVENTEAEIQALLAYCNLPPEPGCFRFWETERAVTTPSAEQVRRPIFREGLAQWRKFEPFLDELKQVLRNGPVPPEEPA